MSNFLKHKNLANAHANGDALALVDSRVTRTSWDAFVCKVFNLANASYKLVRLKGTSDQLSLNTCSSGKLHELETLAETEIEYETILRKNNSNEAGDAIATTGVMQGKSFDAWGTPKSAFKSARWVHKYEDSKGDLFESIDKHFGKIVTPPGSKPPLDIFILDLKNYDEIPALRTEIINYLNNPSYQYHYLVNSTHFKIIN